MEAEQPNPEGQRRIAQMLAKALKQPTKKEYSMPKSGDTRAVREVKEAMQKARSKRSHTQPPEVVQPQEPHAQPGEAISTTSEGCAEHKEHSIRQSINKDSFKELKSVLNNLTESQKTEIAGAGLTDREATEAATTLLAAYKAEGLTPNPDRLATEIIQLAQVGRGIA